MVGLLKNLIHSIFLEQKLRLGFLVNPIAGMGGRVGLKGTDGEAYKEALKRGAKPVAPGRAARFLRALAQERVGVELLVAPGIMGLDYVSRLPGIGGFEVVGKLGGRETSAEDTKRIAGEMVQRGVDLLVFVGGDGTARDVTSAIDARVPLLGVPSGVKMYSSVFAVNPEAAARIIAAYARGEAGLRDAEILDIDEEAYRRGELRIQLYGYVKTPYLEGLLQASKEPSTGLGSEEENKEAIARFFVDALYKRCTLYILGPGTTVKAIADALGVEKTLLGVDAVHNGVLVGRDLDEKGILALLDRYPRAKLVVTPIGGQGFLFGRGNHQISPEVIRRVGRENIVAVATRHKMRGIRMLRVDTGDPELDRELRGYIRVVEDYGEIRMVRVG